MAFITSGGTVLAYAEAVDVRDKDQRLFEQNEVNFTDVPDAPGSLSNYIEDLTQKSTARINQKIRASAQWREYLGFVGNGYDINRSRWNSFISIPHYFHCWDNIRQFFHWIRIIYQTLML